MLAAKTWKSSGTVVKIHLNEKCSYNLSLSFAGCTGYSLIIINLSDQKRKHSDKCNFM